MWIARDPHTGTVHLFELKPVRDGDMFITQWGNQNFVSLGKRPKLSFTLKRGHCKKVKLEVKGVD